MSRVSQAAIPPGSAERSGRIGRGAPFVYVVCMCPLSHLSPLSLEEKASGIEQFYAEHFNDEIMAKRFQSMTIDPGNSVRAKH